MRVLPPAKRLLVVSLLTLVVLLCTFASPSHATSLVRFVLDKRMDGSSVPFAVAANRGLYRAENLDVSTTAVNNSGEALARLAKGDADIVVADFNDLIRRRDGGNGNGVALKAVFILQNENGYAIIARRSRGVDSVSDLQGKTLGVAENDLAIRMWPAVAKRIGIDASKVTLEKIGAAVREPMLSAGQVDAVSGMSYGSALNVRDRGVPRSDLVVIPFSDFGDRSYGQALVVNPAFAAANPEAVSGFIRAVINGIRLAHQDPARATDDVLTQMDGGSRELEYERVRTVLRDQIVTNEVKQSGLGTVSAERFEQSLDQISADFKFRHKPTLQDVFDGAFLPPEGSRKID